MGANERSRKYRIKNKDTINAKRRFKRNMSKKVSLREGTGNSTEEDESIQIAATASKKAKTEAKMIRAKNSLSDFNLAEDLKPVYDALTGGEQPDLMLITEKIEHFKGISKKLQAFLYFKEQEAVFNRHSLYLDSFKAKPGTVSSTAPVSSSSSLANAATNLFSFASSSSLASAKRPRDA